MNKKLMNEMRQPGTLSGTMLVDAVKSRITKTKSAMINYYIQEYQDNLKEDGSLIAKCIILVAFIYFVGLDAFELSLIKYAMYGVMSIAILIGCSETYHLIKYIREANLYKQVYKYASMLTQSELLEIKRKFKLS